MEFLKKLLKEIVARVWLSYKSTLVGLAIGIAIIVVDQIAKSLGAVLPAWAAPMLASLSTLIGASLRSEAVKLQAAQITLESPAPKGLVKMDVLVVAAFTASLIVAGCALLKGASTSTTVTLKDGRSYAVSVTDAGGCVATGAGTWVQIPKTPLECDRVCLDVSPGTVTPGAQCRICDPSNPSLCFPVEFAFPVPVSPPPKTS